MSRLICAAVLATGTAMALGVPAHADTVNHLPLEPVDGMGVDCGPIAQIQNRPDVKFWNYDPAFTTCADAVNILNSFYAAQEKYATVGAWDCGINGAAEVDRTGILIRCVGPRGQLNALQVEQSPA